MCKRSWWRRPVYGRSNIVVVVLGMVGTSVPAAELLLSAPSAYRSTFAKVQQRRTTLRGADSDLDAVPPPVVPLSRFNPSPFFPFWTLEAWLALPACGSATSISNCPSVSFKGTSIRKKPGGGPGNGLPAALSLAVAAAWAEQHAGKWHQGIAASERVNPRQLQHTAVPGISANRARQIDAGTKKARTNCLRTLPPPPFLVFVFQAAIVCSLYQAKDGQNDQLIFLRLRNARADKGRQFRSMSLECVDSIFVSVAQLTATYNVTA